MPAALSMKPMKPPGGLHYFDRSVIKTNWKKINRNPIQQAGNRVRWTARQSIRRRTSKKSAWKRKPSPVGQPPRSWKQGTTPPFKMIFSTPNDRYGASAIIGMVGFNSGGVPVPGLHEHGGTARRRVFIKIPGDENLGATRDKKGRFSKVQPRDDRGRFRKRKRTQFKPVTKMVRYPPRPFMQPALKKVKPQLPRFWKNSLSKAA